MKMEKQYSTRSGELQAWPIKKGFLIGYDYLSKYIMSQEACFKKRMETRTLWSKL